MIKEIASLRLVVLYLGEKNQYGWWQSDFFNHTSENFLKPIFPKSVLLAKYSGALAAASKIHEDHIGLGSVIHLFHMPEYVEQRLHQQIKDDKEIFQIIKTPDSALQFLKDLANRQDTNGQPGPILLDTINSSEMDEKYIESMAATYLDAFESNIKAFPYIRIERQ